VSTDHPWQIHFARPDKETIQISLSGSWRLRDALPSAAEVERHIMAEPSVKRLSFDTRNLTAWDTGLLAFLEKVSQHSVQRHITVEKQGLPEGVRRLLQLAQAVPPRTTQKAVKRSPWLTRVGQQAMTTYRAGMEMITFIGAATLAFASLLRGKARYQKADLALIIQEVGPQALGIVSLISFLVGLILAFVGAVQLRQFGAQIYVADLVGLAMAREMGPMMAAIIVAGRTGAAFAAQLGTMQVNEEIDAFKTLGIPPMEFLVMPRMLALMLMMPLLTLYANLVGILGGAVVGIGMLDLGVLQYYYQTQAAITLLDFGTGLIKSILFGALVAIAGCLRGMQCGRSSAAVGIAATSAVVTGIVFIIVTDAIFAVLFNVLGI
jgi:phospholipid/cholesterol/gamma-HCH transport system permease protein